MCIVLELVRAGLYQSFPIAGKWAVKKSDSEVAFFSFGCVPLLIMYMFKAA